ncbi:adenosylcobinamide-phosphate synthase CbiB [Nitrospira moscoviensis]|uniref:Cobalamin biosynthesis protein CobD n=1 Tax=Nitrospira moscoviensis TaxID=42253 RepID=A0A0K2GBL2_NITMO|nr:adenosylcobinamide-phosphate synthase CbiB [Nitrospira moscoviensis]ALA58259.1 Cobalamin biosynthesis protein CobD [Nitrospira moscoviensis]
MTAVEVLLAAVLDAAIGDPRWLPHPVRAIGAVIAWCDERVRRLCRSPGALRLAGLGLALAIPAAVYLAGRFAIEQAESRSHFFGHAVTIGLAFTTLAGRDLLDHARAVSRELHSGNMPGAREAVAMIVGRDTDDLPEAELVRATVETIAESTTDGVIAPLFYLTVGGAPLALAYKAVNTLDSMVGHLDERHRDVGWASARLDDLANWIPARLAALLIVCAAGLTSGRWRRASDSWLVLWRDGGKHPSPNSGRPEAAMAGALGVQLGGVNYYDGRPQERPRLGDGTRTLTRDDIARASRIMVATYGLGLALAVAALWLT